MYMLYQAEAGISQIMQAPSRTKRGRRVEGGKLPHLAGYPKERRIQYYHTLVRVGAEWLK